MSRRDPDRSGPDWPDCPASNKVPLVVDVHFQPSLCNLTKQVVFFRITWQFAVNMFDGQS